MILSTRLATWDEHHTPMMTIGLVFRTLGRESRSKTGLLRGLEVSSQRPFYRRAATLTSRLGRRLAESKHCATSTSDSDTASNDPASGVTKANASQLKRCGAPKMPRSPSLYQALVPTSSPDRFVVCSLNGSIYAALFNNGSLMGIPCSVSTPKKSAVPGPEVPESLQPTDLQLSTIHPSWIDRFPFPKMRDNMITLLGIINEEEFLADLFCLTSFTLDPGAAPWDPAAWKIGRDFSEKWGYLFY